MRITAAAPVPVFKVEGGIEDGPDIPDRNGRLMRADGYEITWRGYEGGWHAHTVKVNGRVYRVDGTMGKNPGFRIFWLVDPGKPNPAWVEAIAEATRPTMPPPAYQPEPFTAQE